MVNQKTGAGGAVTDPVPELGNIPTYSKKTATKNIKAVAQCSAELLQALIDSFIGSAPEKRSYLKVHPFFKLHKLVHINHPDMR